MTSRLAAGFWASRARSRLRLVAQPDSNAASTNTEIRNPKSETRNKSQTQGEKTETLPVSEFSISDLFRISRLGFRVSRQHVPAITQARVGGCMDLPMELRFPESML